MLDSFHFLRPAWLAIIPVVAVLLAWWLRVRARGGVWQRLVDPALQPHVLISAGVTSSIRWPVLVAAGAAIFAALALAGPSFERLQVPTFRSDSALVVALDLSRSMDATDVAPSRLARAKIKLLSLLDRRAEGETALVVFSSHAFTVTPLTNDTSTIAALVSSVSTDIMPSQGSYPTAGMERAAELLRRGGHASGDILVFSDSQISDDETVMARNLRSEGYTVSVLAVGTAEGAPIPEIDGGFVTDRTGDVVIPRTDLSGLQRLAASGGGRYAQLSPDDSDLERLLPNQLLNRSVAEAEDSDEDFSADVWRDDGIWFVIALLPLLALSFRRGWVCAVLLVFLSYPDASFAFEWADLWQRADQRGQQALDAGDPAAAAQLFEDARWRAAAQYRAEDYEGSASTLSGDQDIAATYNRGNALARSGQLEAAIAQYDDVLNAQPDHEDAAYNRELVAELLEQQQQQQQQEQQNQPQSGEQQQDEEQDSGEDGEQGAQADAQDGEAGDSPSDGEPQQSDQQQDDSQMADNEQQSPEQSEDQSEEGGDPEQLSAAQPQDIEEWASEQAADQWLRRVPQDPGGLLRRKFYYQYQRLGRDQDGEYIWPDSEDEAW